MTFCTEIHGPQMVIHNDFDDPLMCRLVPP